MNINRDFPKVRGVLNERMEEQQPSVRIAIRELRKLIFDKNQDMFDGMTDEKDLQNIMNLKKLTEEKLF